MHTSNNRSTKKIILDCDPGHDDAIAILMAAANPSIELIGITTVAGNQTIEKVTRNALAVCASAGIRVPVARGAEKPLNGHQVIAEDIHGVSGLDGPTLPEPAFELDHRHAVDFIIETVMDSDPNSIHLVPVGPLTNIALAVRKEPRVVERVRSVVLMGGSYSRGNATPGAEFNIFADPEAAEVVFRADWDVTMMGLDLTHQALADEHLQHRIRMIGGPISEFVLAIWEFVGGAYGHQFQFAYPPIHDACCVAMLIAPHLFEMAKADVRVELEGTWTRGMTVVNFEHVPGMRHTKGSAHEQNDFRTNVALKLDWPGASQLIVDAVEKLTEAAG